MNPHLPISKSSHCNCSNSMQSCSSFIQGSIGSGFGGGYAGHRRDVRNGSFESTQIYAEYRSLSWTCGLSISAYYLVSIASSGASDKSFLLCFFFSFFKIRTKPKLWVGELLSCSTQSCSPPVYGREVNQFWCEVSTLNVFRCCFENGIV